MKKVRVITAEEAALMVKDGDTVTTGGFVSCACPEALTKALEKRFEETGHPRDLTLFFAAGQGHRDGTGGDHFGGEGMCKRVVGGHWDRAPRLGDLALANKIEAYNLPQGVITHMFRDIAAHNIGTITHVGLYTFADPRNGGGKLNDVTKEDLVKLVNIEGEERLLYKPIPINVCLVRGSYADEYGNCTVHREIGPLDVTAQCQATKNSGGIVIVQVEKIVQGGTLDPRLVKIPGIYVDAIVVGSPEDNNQCLGMPYDGALSGEFRIPVDDIPSIPLDAKKILARRAAMELPQDAIVNLGTGAPEKIANVAAEEGISDKMTLTGSIGVFGMYPYTVDALKNKLGITIDGVKTNASSDMGAMSPLTPVERATIMRGVDRVYETFTGLVAEGRNLPLERVLEIAGGRVWSGEDALQIGLVDGCGGLKTAVALAADKAELGEDFRLVEKIETPSGFAALLAGFSARVKACVQRSELEKFAEEYAAVEEAVSQRGLVMYSPVRVELR